MNAKQNSKLNMYLAAEAVLTANPIPMAGFLKFSGFFEILQSGIIKIRSLDEGQVSNKSGITVNKGQSRTQVVTLTSDLCRKLRAYATMENNQLLLGETNISETKLKKSKDNELLDIAQATYNRAETHLPELTSYDYTPINQTSLLQAITEYKIAIPTSRISIIETKKGNVQLASAYAEVDDALNNIDILVEVLKVTKPEFYNSYKSARKIINLSTRSFGVKGLVTEAGTGEGLKNVTISLALNGNGLMKAKGNSETIEKKTAAKGGFVIKTLPEGTYSVTVRKTGYADVVTTLNITNGELATLNVELMKN
jgi:PEGA domain.